MFLLKKGGKLKLSATLGASLFNEVWSGDGAKLRTDSSLGVALGGCDLFKKGGKFKLITTLGVSIFGSDSFGVGWRDKVGA